jgi:hypothetical protein
VFDLVKNKLSDYDLRKIDLSLEVGKSGIKRILYQIKRSISFNKKIQEYRKELSVIDKKYEIEHLVLFSEKSLFSQILLQGLKSRVTVWSIDEGLGHYVLPFKNDNLKKIIYRLLTPLLFGFRYEYFRVLGTHPRIDKLVLRLPKNRHVPQNKSKIIDYRTIVPFVEKNNTGNIKAKSKSVLLLTIPNEVVKYSEARIQKVEEIIDFFKRRNYAIFIKPHPRESLKKYEQIENITILDKSIAFEDIDYSMYDYIISDISSSMLDLLSSGYPKNNVIFFNLEYFPNIRYFFSGLNVVENINNLNTYVKDED